MKTLKVFLRSLSIASSILMLTFLAFGADGNVDESFTGNAVRARGSNLVDLTFETSLKQPDGKILIGGNFQTVGGLARSNIARLNADGTVDTTFNPPDITGTALSYTNQSSTSMIYAIALQADGKILIGGDFATVGGISRNRIARLNADGSSDVTFNANASNQFDPLGGQNIIRSIEVLPDGRILLAGNFCYLLPTTGNRCQIVRLNSDGTIDSSFQAAAQSHEKIKLLPDGRILNFGNIGIKRLTSEGAVDSTFESTSSVPVEEAVILPNNQIVVVGGFTIFQGFTAGRIARLFSNGTLDTSFSAGSGASGIINDIHYLPDGKFLIGGSFFTYAGATRNRVARLNSNGSLDTTFNYPSTTSSSDGVITEVSQFDNGLILIGGKTGYWDRIQFTEANGSILIGAAPLIGMSAYVNAVAQQADGKVLVGGRFTVANGFSRNNLARYNADGTIDTTFVPFTSNISQFFVVRKILPLSDGKILVAMQGEKGLVRLNANGSLDTTFNVGLTLSSDVRDIEILNDGKIIAVGNIFRSNNNGNYAAVRYEQFGGFEAGLSFDHISGEINAVAIQPDGKLIVGGEFSQITVSSRGRIARLNSNFTLDITFSPSNGANGQVRDLALQSDGKVVLVGDFTTLNGNSTQQYVGRLNSNGSLDGGFSQTASYNLNTVKIQDNGKILIGGAMRTIGGLPRSGIARLNYDGTIDTAFQTGTGTNGPVYDIELQNDKKILVGGDFTFYNGSSKVSVARLQNTFVIPVVAKFDFDGDGRADISVYRPSNNVWYQLLGQNYQFSSVSFGASEDILAPADYDGDGKTDLGIFRPSTGVFWYRSTANGNAFRAVQWGQSGDVPLPSDFNGDGKDDYIVYRPSNNTWYRLTDNQSTSIITFGSAGDKPVIGDFDGDGKSDPAIFRPSTGVWWYAASTQNNTFRAVQFGANGDIPAVGDFDGDSRTDFAVYRPSNGGWYILNSSNNSVTILGFGLSGDKPVVGDYDGDGKADISVYRPSNGVWYLNRSSAGFTGIQLGTNTDKAIPNAFIQQ